MAKAILVILVFCVAYVNCQVNQACIDANAAFQAMAVTCGQELTAAAMAGDTATFCSGTCAGLYMDIITSCGTVSMYIKV